MQTKMLEKAPNSSDLATRVLAQRTGSDRLLKFASHSFFFWSCYNWSVIQLSVWPFLILVTGYCKICNCCACESTIKIYIYIKK